MLKLLDHSVMHKDRFVLENSAHRQDVLILVEEGSFECRMRDEDMIAAKYDAMFFKKDVAFSRRVSEPLTLHYCVLQEGTFPQEEPFAGKMAFEDKRRVHSTLQLLNRCDAAESDEGDMLSFKEHLIRDICCQYLLERTRPGQARSPVVEDALIEHALGFIHMNFGRKISIRQLAEDAGLTHVQFLRRFKRTAGANPIDYILSLRIKRARHLLIETDLKIFQIADRCGFENEFYFSNCFKKHIGVSPLGYRNRHLL